MRIYSGRRLNIERLIFSPDGLLIAATGPTPGPQGYCTSVWDLNGGDTPKHTVVGHILNSFTADCGRLLLFTTTRHVTFDLMTGVLSPDDGVNELRPAAVSPDGRWAVTCDVDNTAGRVRLCGFGSVGDGWRRGWEREVRYAAYGRPESSAIDPFETFAHCGLEANGAHLLLAIWVYNAQPDHGLFQVFDTTTGEPVSVPRRVPPALVDSPRALFEGRLVALERHTLHVTHLARPNLPPLTRTARSRKHFTAAAFSPDGRLLATTSNDTTVTVWDTAAWQPAQQYAWDIGRLRAVTFAPDGLTCAAGSDTGKVVLFDVDV